MPGEAVAQMGRPIHQETAIGWLERGDIRQRGNPARVRSQAGPGRTAKRQDRHVWVLNDWPVRGFEPQAAIGIPTRPSMPDAQADIQCRQPPHPRAQQGRGLHRIWENPSAGTGEGGLTQTIAPGDQGIRWKGADRGLQPRPCRTVSRQEDWQWFGVSQIQAAASGHQQLAANGWHLVVNGDADARLGQDLGRHQARGATADNRRCVFHPRVLIHPAGLVMTFKVSGPSVDRSG